VTVNGPNRGRITAIERQARDPERVSVFLDGAFAFGLPAIDAAQEGLHVGDQVSEKQVERLRALDERAKAVGSALNLIARRPRSEREVRDRLKRKGYPSAAIDAAVAKLEGWRYLDDEAFARYWVENREANKPRGRRLLEQELRLKGVDRETIRQTIDETEIDEAAGAIEIARAKLRTYGNLEPVVARRRLGAFLVRRGYGYDVVRSVLDRLFAEADEEEPPDGGDSALF
jgi:regulatory protein